MREILFRGKQKSNGKWIYGQYYINPTDDKDEHFIATHEIGWFCAVEKDTVGQFTGLTDKNGKKIFEGDIVEFEYCAKLGTKWIKIKGFVEFSFGIFYINNKGNFYMSNNFGYGYILGNIHDNPELLGGAK